jgi:membrane-bound serine protease (ClpP class)
MAPWYRSISRLVRGSARSLPTLLSLSVALLLGWFASPVRDAYGEAEKAAAGKIAAEAKAPPAGETPERRRGRFIRIVPPITDKLDNRVRLTIDATIKEAKKQGQWPVFVLELHPGRTEFGQALDLAKFLSSSALNGATTVAFLPETITGHNVLVAMACDEIIMRDDAEIGEAGKFEQVIEPSMRNAYVEIANRRKTIPADLALGMLDPALEVLVVETDVSRELVLSDRLPELRKNKSFQASKVIKPAGKPGLFSGRQGRELGFVSYLAADRADVAKIWKLPREAVADDPSIDGQWRPVRVYLKGPVRPKMMDQLQSMIQNQIRDHDANLICLWIDSPGGSPTDSLNFANYLASLDPSKRRTVAYIQREARGDAALVALACDHVVMHAGAELGGSGAAPITDEDLPVIVPVIEGIAKQKFRSPALMAAIVDPHQPVFRCVRKSDGLVDYFTDARLANEPGADAWRKEAEVTTRGQVLQMDGQKAEELGLASDVVANFGEFKALYGLEHDPQLVEPSWATTLIEALNSPGVSWFLLFLGGAALYAELQAPGIGLGGIIGALCFLLYFWSAYLGGTAGWLEAILFVSGLSFLLLELFVFPGVAVFGVSGGLLIVTSLVLASQTFVLPHNEYQMNQLRTSLTVLAGAGVAALAAAIAMNRYLPHTPMFNRMLLAPPSPEERSDISRREATAQLEHLIGTQGVTSTPLMPSGKARFGDELVDVIADGEFIDRGRSVVVMQVRGNRVVVRAVS